jgi:hypothetical protein
LLDVVIIFLIFFHSFPPGSLSSHPCLLGAVRPLSYAQHGPHAGRKYVSCPSSRSFYTPSRCRGDALRSMAGALLPRGRFAQGEAVPLYL